MPCLEPFFLKRVDMTRQRHKILMEVMLSKDVARPATFVHDLLGLVELLVVERVHEVIYREADGEHEFFRVGLGGEEVLARGNEGVDVLEPFGDRVVLEGEVTVEHHLPERGFVRGVGGGKAGEGEILEAEGCEVAFYRWLVDVRGAFCKIATSFSGRAG